MNKAKIAVIHKGEAPMNANKNETRLTVAKQIKITEPTKPTTVTSKENILISTLNLAEICGKIRQPTRNNEIQRGNIHRRKLATFKRNAAYFPSVSGEKGGRESQTRISSAEK